MNIKKWKQNSSYPHDDENKILGYGDFRQSQCLIIGDKWEIPDARVNRLLLSIDLDLYVNPFKSGELDNFQTRMIC